MIKGKTGREMDEVRVKSQAAIRMRKAYRHNLMMGDVKPSRALEHLGDLPHEITRMKVSTFLRAIPGVGKVKCERIMEEVGIHQERRLSGLNERQTRELIEACGKFEG